MKAQLQDKDILSATKQVNKEGQIFLKYLLPDGEEMTSGSIPRQKMKADVLVKWCQAVRERWESRQDNDRAEMEKIRQERIAKEEKERLAALKAAEDAGIKQSGNVILSQDDNGEETKSSTAIIVPDSATLEKYSDKELDSMVDEYFNLRTRAARLKNKLKRLGVDI